MNRPAFLTASGEAPRPYHYWTGRSGQSYVHSVYRPHEAPQLAGASVVVVRRRGERRQPMLVADTGAEPSFVFCGRAFADALARGANEVHVHVPAQPEDAGRVRADLGSVVQPSRQSAVRRPAAAAVAGGSR